MDVPFHTKYIRIGEGDKNGLRENEGLFKV